MDGFNVLNEIAGSPIRDVTATSVVLGVLFVFGFAVMCAGAEQGKPYASLLGLVLLVVTAISLCNVGLTHDTGEISPTRYEITLKPGVVIDATRWDIVERRGEIYVIQERKPDAD